MNRKWILFLPFFLTDCGYKGDGEYNESGWFLKNYSLILPQKDFASNREYSFSINGYGSHDTSFLRVRLSNDEPVNFHELDTTLEVRIIGKNNVTYFYRSSPLNAHYLRMVELGEAQWANDLEWHSRYQYSDEKMKNRAVSFDPASKPISTSDVMYIHSFPSGTENYKVNVKIGNVPEAYENTKISLEFISGWK
ncbi:hypothetical protein Q4561_19605 [Alteromonas sp. 1_MG-2023]|uniref:hypothetical protein n=1 Tax=Alteromonas TaxID=226 RepID=UPI001D427380|nr:MULTISPECIES: hypothetical protein [Alteromonas]MBZ2164336.1 hypothetical protein [Alteromonas stellipolaris]MDO6569277.1 hypothetical protein [Alteromonas sp. 1_MG-2023]